MTRLTRPHSETEAELLKDPEYVKALSLELDDTIKESKQVMKRCQAGTNNYDKANNLHAECYGTIGVLIHEIERLRTENEALMQQAQIWKQEARTMQNTVAECYQAVTGSTGELGDWNGAKPVREAISELKQERDKMESAFKTMISVYIVDDYIYGEDRLNEVNKRFDRMMREA